MFLGIFIHDHILYLGIGLKYIGEVQLRLLNDYGNNSGLLSLCFIRFGRDSLSLRNLLVSNLSLLLINFDKFQIVYLIIFIFCEAMRNLEGIGRMLDLILF